MRGVLQEEHLFTSQLAELLTRSLRVPIDVVNAAVSGYSTDQEYLLFREIGPRLRPDLVLLVMCDNDFEGNTEDFVYHRYYKPFFTLDPAGSLSLHDSPAPRLDRVQSLKLWLGERSNLWNLLRSRRSRSPFLQAQLDRLQVAKPQSSGEDEIALAAVLVTAFRSTTEGLGARFVMANTGHRGEKTTLFTALRPRLDAAGVAYQGLEAALADGRHRSPREAWDFPDDTHWNVASHALVARTLYVYLRRVLAEDLARDGKG